MKKKVGFIGWRGMVGSVLLKRMLEEKDFLHIKSIFFSTSQIGEKNPKFSNFLFPGFLKDAYNIEELKKLDIIITCQGSLYTQKVFPILRSSGWSGYWIDAASDLRMNKDALIVLDPINHMHIKNAIYNGIKTFVGGNCTVSLMMLALGGLFRQNLIKWVSFSTYQAASGAGSKYIKELLEQINFLNQYLSKKSTFSQSILKIEKNITSITKNFDFPKKNFLIPLILNLIPWIDSSMPNGQSKEEWKMESETNKILSTENNNRVLIDGTCVRVSSLRCHSQSFVIKLKKDISLHKIEEILSNDNKWVKVISNDKESTLKELTPLSVTGTLNIPIGRLRKLNIGSKYLSAFTIGDQLLWGAAEPLRRMLKFLV
ncbi:Aspartate-semialdehyde dehydrogenase [Buchnera aphidicola (Chaitophorus sp. 3695)]|uniref:aspartate-semialdehyde dehydrogenase n=1 Tax=Buchnera aphidicola TaxID=9 RepID=UPI0034639853